MRDCEGTYVCTVFVDACMCVRVNVCILTNANGCTLSSCSNCGGWCYSYTVQAPGKGPWEGDGGIRGCLADLIDASKLHVADDVGHIASCVVGVRKWGEGHC